MTPCRRLLNSGDLLSARSFLWLVLLLAVLLPLDAMAQGFGEDLDLLRLQERASRLRELQGWEAAISDQAPQPAPELSKPSEPAASAPLPSWPPPEPSTDPHPPLSTVQQNQPAAMAPLATEAAWQALLWLQDSQAERVGAELDELTRRLLILEERSTQLSSTLSWLSGGMALLLAVGCVLALRRRRTPVPIAVQEGSRPAAPPYLPLAALHHDHRLATCEFLLLSGHFRQCLQLCREASADAIAEELPLLLFFESAASRLLGEADDDCERRLRAKVRQVQLCDWPLGEIDSWLLLADMKEEDRSHLGALLDELRPSPEIATAANENPSGRGEVFYR